MNTSSTACPECGKTDIRFREKRNDWFCDDCDHRWTVDESVHSPAKADSQHKVQLFLSYGRADSKELADRLSVDLAAAGYDIWQDTTQIRASHAWHREIEDGLHSSQIVIALLSPHAVRRQNDTNQPAETDSVCLDEISYAQFELRRPVVPVMAQMCSPPLFIHRLDYVDLCAWRDSESQYNSGLARLLEALSDAAQGKIRYRSWADDLPKIDFASIIHLKRKDFTGRQWLFDKIDAWRIDSEERALLIKGDPGIGKSAIVAQLLHMNPSGQVLAYHFCQADTPDTLNPGRFVRSLAGMIASQIDAYAQCLEQPEIKTALSHEQCESDPASALERGILSPLQNLPSPEEGIRYILIDALDEALTHGSAGTRTIIDLLASRLDRLPPWLRIVATTRNEREVLDRLRGLRAEQIDAASADNLDDITCYIENRLDSPNLAGALQSSSLSRDEAIRILRKNSDGNFLYVQQALQGVERNQHRFDDLALLPPGLFGLYQTFFERHFPDEASYGPVQRVLQVVVAAREPLTEEQLATASGLDIEEELPSILRHLSAYLPCREEPGSPATYAVYHKSFADWLTAKELRGTRYYISPKRGHKRLADCYWDEYQRGAAAMSHYGLAYLPVHLIAAEQWDQLETVLTDLRFIQAKCMAQMTFDLVGNYSLALDALPELQEEREKEQQHQQRLRQYGADLIVYAKAKGEGVSLPAPPDTSVLGKIAPMEADAQQPGHQTKPTRARSIRTFANFVSTQNHTLNRFSQETLVVAWNHASAGLVVDQAESLTLALARPWLARDPRPPAPPHRPQCQQTLLGHTSFVNSVAITPDGRRAVSASEDNTLKVWDLETGEEEKTLQGHTREVNSVEITPDGCRAVSAGHDHKIKVWDLETGEEEKTLQGHSAPVNSVTITPDGRRAVSASGRYDSSDNTLKVWDLETGEEEKTLQGHSAPVSSVTITPDGRRAVSASCDNTLKVWDLETGAEEKTLQGHTDTVTSVSITPDGRRAVSASYDNTLKVWDLETGDCEQTLQGHTYNVYSVAITPDGRLAVSASNDKTLKVWSLETGAEEKTLQGHTSIVCSVAITPDGRHAVSASYDKTLKVWNLETGEEEKTLQGHTSSVNSVAITPNERRAVSASWDKTLKVWNLETGAEEKTLQGHTCQVSCVAITPDGRRAVSGSWDYGSAGVDNPLKVWDLETGAEEKTFLRHTGNVLSVAITPDGRRSVSANYDNTLKVWNLDTGAEEKTLQGHTSSVNFVAITPDGRLAVSAGDYDDMLMVWDLETGTEEKTLQGHIAGVSSVSITPDGRRVVSASYNTLKVWNLETGVEEKTLKRHTDGVNSVAISPDGRLVVSASNDKTLKVWDLETGEEKKTLQGHTDKVTSVAITPDGRRALSASDDNTLKVWNLETGDCDSTYFMAAVATAVAVHGPDRIVCGTDDGQMHFLTLRNFE